MVYLEGDGGGLEHESGRIFLLFVCYLNGLLSGVLNNRIGLVLLCATILHELFWNVWILFLLTVFVLLYVVFSEVTTVSRGRRGDLSVKTLVLGIVTGLTCVMWHQHTWFCWTLRGKFKDASALVPFVFGYLSTHNFLWLRRLGPCRRVLGYLLHSIVVVLIIWLMSPYHDMYGMHENIVSFLAAVAGVYLFVVAPLRGFLFAVALFGFVAFMRWVSDRSNPASLTEFPGGARTTTLFVFVYTVYSLI